MGNHHSIEAREALMAAIEAQDVKKMKNHIKTLSSSSSEEGEEGDKEGFLSFRVYGLTPFHCCVNNNFVEGAKLLLTYPGVKESVRWSDRNFNSPLHCAIENQNLEMCQIILETKHPDLGYATNNKGETVITQATRLDNFDIFKLIITEFSNNEAMNWKDVESGSPPLLQAMIDNKTEYVKLFLDCPITNPTMANNQGETTLDLACQKNNLEIISKLLQLGALVNVTTATGRTPLHSSLLFSSFEAFLLLIQEKEKEVVFEAWDRDGCCPLHYIRMKKEEEIEKAKSCVEAYLKKCPNSLFWENNEGLKVIDQIPKDEINASLREFIEEKMKEMKKGEERETCGFELQFVSDLHIEFLGEGEFPQIERVCPNLALLGDIGVVKEEAYRTFLLQMAEKFERVFVVAGNHEFYHSSITETLSTINRICDERKNLHFLNNTSFVVGGENEEKSEKSEKKVRLLGCTLWGNVKDEELEDVKQCANDFRAIRLNNEENAPKLTPDDTKKMHRESVDFLTKELKEAGEKGEEVVILSHHCPVENLACSHPNEMGPKAEQKLHSFNCTDLQHLFCPPLHTWVYGHTHWFQDMEVKGVRVRSNPCGYPQEKHMGDVFDEKRVVKL